MERRDARKLTGEAKEELRRLAIKLHGQKGNAEIARQLEVHPSTVSTWVNKYKKQGWKALRALKVGRPKGSAMQLTGEEQKATRRHLIDKTPDQMKLNFALWTREAVGLLIKEKTGKDLDLRQVGRYLKRWGLTPQRPLKRAYQRDDVKVQKWLREEYPSIKKKAKKEGGEVHWADETGIKSHDHRGRGYALRGQTPVRLHNPSYEKVNLISSVTNQGKLRFMCYEGSFTYRVFHRFLKRLITEAEGRKLHVVVDNLRVHHAKVIQRWLRVHQSKIEVHYLPSYAPELNPDEYFNCDLKTELSKRPERRTKGKWTQTVEKTLSFLQKQPERITKYFQAKPIQYAA